MDRIGYTAQAGDGPARLGAAITMLSSLRCICSLLLILHVLAADVSASDISLHGFLQGNYAAGVTTPNPDGGNFKLAEERLQALQKPFRPKEFTRMVQQVLSQ